MILLPLFWLGNSSDLGYLTKAWLNSFKFIRVYFSFLFLLFLTTQSRARIQSPLELPLFPPQPQSVAKIPIIVVVFYQRSVRPVGPTPGPSWGQGWGRKEGEGPQRASHLFYMSQVSSPCQTRVKLNRVFFPCWFCHTCSLGCGFAG